MIQCTSAESPRLRLRGHWSDKIPDLPNENAFPSGMHPIKIWSLDDIKHVVKYTDYDQQDFRASGMERNQEKEQERIKYRPNNGKSSLKCKLKTCSQ
jgi:hypothetical protein